MKTDTYVKHELLLEMRKVLDKATRKGLKFYLLTYIDGNEIIPISIDDIGIRKFEE